MFGMGVMVSGFFSSLSSSVFIVVFVMMVMMYIGRLVIVLGINSMKILLCGVCSRYLVVMLIKFVIVDFVISVGIMCRGLWVVKGMVFFVIKEMFSMFVVLFVFCLFLVKWFLNSCVVKNSVSGGVMFVVIVVVMGL